VRFVAGVIGDSRAVVAVLLIRGANAGRISIHEVPCLRACAPMFAVVHPGKVEPMPRLRLLRRRSRRYQRLACILHLWVGCTLLLTGCSQGDPAEAERLYLEWSKETTEAWALAPNAEELPAVVEAAAPVVAEPKPSVKTSRYWQFSDDTRLVCLPAVEGDAPVVEVAETKPLGVLLMPVANPPVMELQVQEADASRSPNAPVANATTPGANAQETPGRPLLRSGARAYGSPKFKLPGYQELSAEEQQLLNVIERETLTATTGVLTDARLEQECRDKIAAAFALAQRGASFAARQELIEVLRKISQAKDSREGSRNRSASLAAGLRALEEAEDFAPRGTQLEAELALEIVCASHRTPLARELDLTTMLPSQMMERYNRYAQIKLAVAVAGEPAGSMALYTLGKLNSQLKATDPEQHPLATRRAVAFQQAALLAHNENYLAAHELGLLLAETGHFPEAKHLLAQVATEQPNVVVYRNLARIEEALGDHAQAQFCRAEGERLAQLGRGPQGSIAWVSKQEFSRNQMNNFNSQPQVASRPTAPSATWR
jgi:tetratricopeptide (TPR) repeat protein